MVCCACDVSEDDDPTKIVVPESLKPTAGIMAKIPVRSSVARVIFLRANCEPTRRGRRQSLGSARLGSARLGSARLGSARLGSARLGSARL
ncbi:MAG: hypothetical protein OXB98_02680, partial [Bryobacterales bacterium]|nr:hypothetical protein [Bryobacterales bacterium]